MKLLTKELLNEFGFISNKEKSKESIKVLTRDKMDIVLKTDGSFYYTNLGIDYPLRDIASLRKLYKEMRREELKPLK